MTNELTYIDLFAGCGGLSTGLHLSGWKGLFAVERHPDAFQTLKANLIEKHKHFLWPKWLEITNWDIRDILDQKRDELIKLRGQVTLIAGGPPCQGFSSAGRRQESDERNNLVHTYLEFVQLVQPKAILFENVQGFTMKFTANANSGELYSKLVIESLHDLGYKDACGQILDTYHFGIPQRRKRFIVIATRHGKASVVFQQLFSSRIDFLKSKGIPLKNSARSAISDLEKRHGTTPCLNTPGFLCGVRATRATTGLQKYLRNNCTYLRIDSHRFANHTNEVKEVFTNLLEDAPRNRSIYGAEREPFGLKKRSVTILDPNRPAPTVTTLPDDLLHYSEPRIMTVRECARLQTFPDWFEFKGPYTTGGKRRKFQTPRYTQVGNAVPPLFAELLGMTLKEAMTNE